MRFLPDGWLNGRATGRQAGRQAVTPVEMTLLSVNQRGGLGCFDKHSKKWCQYWREILLSEHLNTHTHTDVIAKFHANIGNHFCYVVFVFALSLYCGQTVWARITKFSMCERISNLTRFLILASIALFFRPLNWTLQNEHVLYFQFFTATDESPWGDV